MNLPHFEALAFSVLAIGIAEIGCTAAHAETVRYVCTNTEGAPDLVEVNFDLKTALEFAAQSDGSITPMGDKVAATITGAWIRWSDTFDGSAYSIRRSTGVLKKLVEGTAIYTKHCKNLPSGTSGWK